MSSSLFEVGDRVDFTGPEDVSGTVVNVRESTLGAFYRVHWDDGKGGAIEFGADELSRSER